jgi:DNA-binding GntR family transcriptional regulator
MLDTSSPLAQSLLPAGEAKNAFALKRLRRAIIACELRPGAAVSEREIAERYGLGRAATRVALTTLAAESFVTPQARHGWRVLPVSGALVGHVLCARHVIEPTLATIALSPAEAAALHGNVNLVAALRERGDQQSVTTARVTDRQIMDHLATRAGGFVARWLGQVWNHVERIAAAFDGDDLRFRAADRERLVDALAGRDAAAARAEIEREIDRFQAFVTDRLLRDPAVLAAQPVKGRLARAGKPQTQNHKRDSAMQQGNKSR